MSADSLLFPEKTRAERGEKRERKRQRVEWNGVKSSNDYAKNECLRGEVRAKRREREREGGRRFKSYKVNTSSRGDTRER